MESKEASARIKINKLLEQAGWRFEDSEKVEFKPLKCILIHNFVLTCNLNKIMIISAYDKKNQI